MEEIVYRLRMNCPLLTTLDLSSMNDIWMDRVLSALTHNTRLQKLKVKDTERRMEWMQLPNRKCRIYFVDNFVAIDGGDNVLYHIFNANKI